MNEEKKLGGTLNETAPYLTLGIQLAITLVVFFFIGKYADGYFGTKPWLLIAALLIGSVGGMINFFRTVVELSKKEEHERNGKK